MTALWRIVRLWRADAPVFLAAIVVSLLAAAALAGLALAAGLVATPVAIGGGALLIWLLRGLGAGRVVLRYAERLLTHLATFRGLTRLRVWLFRGLASRSGGGLGMQRSGDVLARLVDDVNALDGLFIRIAVPALAVLVLLPALLVALWPGGAGLALGVGALFLASAVLLPFLAARGTRRAGAKLTVAAGMLRVAVVDVLAGLREIRAFGAEGRMLAMVQAREAGLFRAQRTVARHAALAQAGAFLCGQAALLLLLLAPGLGWVLAPAVIFPAILLTLVAFELVGGMPLAGALAGLADAASVRIVAAAADGAAPAAPAARLALPAGTTLRFAGVRFAWPDRPPLLDGLELEVPAGAKVAILGPSGSGKSTLAALALQVVAPQEGRVLLGGVDTARIDPAKVRSRMAWLSQGTTLFEDTIRANLLLGRPDAPDAALWDALAQAGLDTVVRELPQGLDTWLGSGGAGLSGGQGRRVALARALLSAAPVLILDEPAAGLDPAAERAFLSTLNQAAPDRTVILIVHRLTGVERLDRIWRLSGGRAVAATG